MFIHKCNVRLYIVLIFLFASLLLLSLMVHGKSLSNNNKSATTIIKSAAAAAQGPQGPQENNAELEQTDFSSIFLRYDHYTIYYIDIPAHYTAVNITYYCTPSNWGCHVNVYTKFNSIPTFHGSVVDGTFIGRTQAYLQTDTVRKESSSSLNNKNATLYVLVLNTSPYYSERLYIKGTLLDDSNNNNHHDHDHDNDHHDNDHDHDHDHKQKETEMAIIVCGAVIGATVLIFIALIIVVIAIVRRMLKRRDQKHYLPFPYQPQSQQQTHHHNTDHNNNHYLMLTNPHAIPVYNTSYGAVITNGNQDTVYYPVLENYMVVDNNVIHYQQQANNQQPVMMGGTVLTNSAYNLPPQQQPVDEDVKKDAVMNQQQQQQQSMNDNQKM
ncbi:hypothetical protein ABK040_004580 [Willaertia magna]